jgi:CheY-like chemotaxis protein
MSNEIQKAMKDILSYSDLIKQTHLNEKQQGFIDAIYAGAHKLSWIINDILDLSQIESGKVEIQSIDFNLEYLINDVFKKTVAKKKGRPVDTYIDIAKDVSRNLVGDPTRLRQILANLLSHAFKNTLKGEVGIIVNQSSGNAAGDTAKDHTVRLTIVVKDSGSGIPQSKRDSIFELQSQDDPSKSWAYGGTGLGLSICKLIVEAMGGTISVTSEEGQGSAFNMEIPFKTGRALRDREVYPLTRDELVGKKAIIVDDNEISRKVLNKCCHSMGLEPVLITSSPQAVLDMLEDMAADDYVPDVILCDLMMPEMDGYELAKRVRINEKFKDIKLIAVTSAVRIGSARSAEESGFNGFLPKPVFLDELAKVIATVLGDKRKESTIVTRHMAEEMKFTGTKVLVIGEKGSDQRLVENCLEVMDCERDFVANGQAALECLSEKIYDLCLLDSSVYQTEGAELVRIIKEISRNLPTIVLLSEDMLGHREECLNAGVDDFIIKPVDMVGLKRIIQRYGKK